MKHAHQSQNTSIAAAASGRCVGYTAAQSYAVAGCSKIPRPINDPTYFVLLWLRHEPYLSSAVPTARPPARPPPLPFLFPYLHPAAPGGFPLPGACFFSRERRNRHGLADRPPGADRVRHGLVGGLRRGWSRAEFQDRLPAGCGGLVGGRCARRGAGSRRAGVVPGYSRESRRYAHRSFFLFPPRF